MLVINVLHIVLECHYYREHPKSIYYNRKGAKMVHPLLDMHRDGHTHQQKKPSIDGKYWIWNKHQIEKCAGCARLWQSYWYSWRHYLYPLPPPDHEYSCQTWSGSGGWNIYLDDKILIEKNRNGTWIITALKQKYSGNYYRKFIPWERQWRTWYQFWN